MGEKGARQTPAGAAMAERLRDDFAELGNVTTRKMFGGHGVFESDVMFALIDSTGTPFLRADDATSPEFEAAGAHRHGRMPYWTIPASVLRDERALVAWADRSLSVARAAKR